MKLFFTVALWSSILIISISTSYAGKKQSSDYKDIRQKIETACYDPSLELEQRAIEIYKLLPVTNEEIDKLYFGDNDQDKWNLDKSAEGKICSDLIYKTQHIVPVNSLIEKYQEIMDANPIDIKAITNLKHNIDKFYNYRGVDWYYFPDYMDNQIALPLFPGETANDDYNIERTNAFLKLLKQQSDDYVLRFMLLVSFDGSGDVSLNVDDYDIKMAQGTLIQYASPKLIKTFPQWYKAWNKMVPTLCQRLQAFRVVEIDDNYVQEACGDLRSAKQYQVSKERQLEFDKEIAQ